MTYGVYAVRDVKMGFAQPILDTNDETAIRNFGSQCKSVQLNPTLFYYPEDYSLYKIGDYVTETAELIPINPPKHLIDAVNFKNEE